MITAAATRIAAAWDRFWYRPAAAVNLAAARVIICAHAIWLLGSRDLAAISGVPEVFWAGVPAGDQWRFLLFPGHPGLEYALTMTAFAALVAGLLGIWPRIACFCAGLLLYHLAPLETIYWTPNPFERGLTVATIALLVLSFSRSGDALRLWPRQATPTPPSSDYQWPLRLIQLQVCQVYFIAGWAKLYHAGFEWASAGNIGNWLTVFAQQDQIPVVSSLGLWLADHAWACWLIGASALTLDLGLITMVVWPHLRPWLISAAILFHTGILLTMGILFLTVPHFLVFIDWTALGRRRRGEAVAGIVDPQVAA